jgi:hypothetical protein
MGKIHIIIGSLAASLLLLLLAGATWPQSAKTPRKSDGNAMRVLDEFMAAWNASDPHRLAATCNFPHVRIAGGKVTVWQTPTEFEKEHGAGRAVGNSIPLEHNWHHSAWDYRKVVQTSNDKVHVALSFTRYDAKGSKIATYESLYVITNQDGHWGVQARSSFAR